MGKFDNALIFSDIDGTYLGTGNVTVARNEEALRYFQAEGGLFTFATGRMEKNLPHGVPNVKELVNFPVLLSNGASLYDFRTDTRIFSLFMAEETVLPALEYAFSAYPQVGVRATVPGGFLYAKDHPLLARDMRKVLDDTWKKPYTEWDHSRIYKVVFRGEDEELSVMQKDLSNRYADVFEIILSEKGILEIQRKGVSKGASIEKIRREFEKQGAPKKIFCIGDYENDLEMLRAADFAACPANAIDSVKKVSDIHVCDCNEGAIADLIEYIDRHSELLR